MILMQHCLVQRKVDILWNLCCIMDKIQVYSDLMLNSPLNNGRYFHFEHQYNISALNHWSYNFNNKLDIIRCRLQYSWIPPHWLTVLLTDRMTWLAEWLNNLQASLYYKKFTFIHSFRPSIHSFIHSCLFAISQIISILKVSYKDEWWQMVRKPERNHGADKESGFLRTNNKWVSYDKMDQQK